VGEVASLPAAVSQSAYRIVQESLTNSLKHAGRDAQARVRVSREADACTIEVVDDGAGRVASPLPGDGPGHGLIGMRERADVFGGEVSAGPRTDQPGFIVHVRLPLNGRVPA